MEKYPDEHPVFEITEYENIEEDQVQELLDLMTTQVQRNLVITTAFVPQDSAVKKNLPLKEAQYVPV